MAVVLVAFGEDQVGLAVQGVVLPLAELVFLLTYETSIPIQLRFSVFIIDNLALIRKHIRVILCILGPYPAKHGPLREVRTILDTHDFLNPIDSPFIFELEATFLIQLFKIEFSGGQVGVEEFTAVGL